MTSEMGEKRPDNEENLTPAEQLDQTLARRALEKQRLHENLTREESAALRRTRKIQEEKLRWRYYESIPQKHWREMSGRQSKILIEQEAATGIPFGGSIVNLPAVVRGWHDFLAKNKYKLAADEGEEGFLQGASQDVKNEHVRLKNVMLNMDIEERKKELIPRFEMHKALGEFAKILRDLGESLYHEFGVEAQRSVVRALEDFERSIGAFFILDVDDPNVTPLADGAKTGSK